MTDCAMGYTTQLLLEQCREIEYLCRDLYRYFAGVFAGDVEMASLWNKTAEEEENHAQQFTLALRLAKSLACEMQVDQAKVESVYAQLQRYVDKVMSAPPAAGDALYDAIKIERYVSEFHLDCVAKFDDKSFNGLFRSMMSSDNDHIASLQRAYYKLKGEVAP